MANENAEYTLILDELNSVAKENGNFLPKHLSSLKKLLDYLNANPTALNNAVHDDIHDTPLTPIKNYLEKKVSLQEVSTQEGISDLVKEIQTNTLILTLIKIYKNNKNETNEMKDKMKDFEINNFDNAVGFCKKFITFSDNTNDPQKHIYHEFYNNIQKTLRAFKQTQFNETVKPLKKIDSSTSMKKFINAQLNTSDDLDTIIKRTTKWLPLRHQTLVKEMKYDDSIGKTMDKFSKGRKRREMKRIEIAFDKLKTAFPEFGPFPVLELKKTTLVKSASEIHGNPATQPVTQLPTKEKSKISNIWSLLTQGFDAAKKVVADIMNPKKEVNITTITRKTSTSTNQNQHILTTITGTTPNASTLSTACVVRGFTKSGKDAGNPHKVYEILNPNLKSATHESKPVANIDETSENTTNEEHRENRVTKNDPSKKEDEEGEHTSIEGPN